jgi:phosphoribosylaminoimidazole-succinocarboxamide synthase
MDIVNDFTIGQLRHLHSGKVREIYRAGPGRLLIVATDRLSAFDRVLRTPIPHKGAVLGSLSAFWFERTRDIVENHLIEQVDPNVSLVREARPIRLEMIVRGYLCGSMWRKYRQGKRVFSGKQAPDGLRKHDPLPEPLVTPTTKEASDREIDPETIVAEGWTTRERYAEMERIALALFRRGSELLAEKGIILVDTKYEFGLLDDRLVLIDELHTPDSSRFWPAEGYRADREGVEQLDKEFVRQWLLAGAEQGSMPDALPEEVIAETSRRYCAIYEAITGCPAPRRCGEVTLRIRDNLVERGIIRPGYVVLIMGSTADLEHCRKIREVLERYGVAVHFRVVSAHKNGEAIPELARYYNRSLEPGAVIAVAGLSNGLGGALAANLNLPVINCPPFKDGTDMQINLNSSLMMPSKTPAATVVRPESAALFALRSLNLPALRRRFTEEIAELKSALRADDERVREL